jgi:hydrogenase maturation protease
LTKLNTQPAKILVLGIGNILLQDEGIGVRVIEYLQTNKRLPGGVELVDGGTAGADLIDVLADRQLVIIVDAVDFDAPAGTILRITPNDWLPRDNALSLHDLDIPQTLAMTRLLGCAPEKVVCFGIVPQTINPGMTMSHKMTALIPLIADLVLLEINTMNAPPAAVYS